MQQLPLKQSPSLKSLRLWLEGHPHYNVDPTWGPLVIEWVSAHDSLCSFCCSYTNCCPSDTQGALKPDMYHRILSVPVNVDSHAPEYEPVSD